jgi:tetratricopeptide (TPR) repeat protein
MVRRRDFTAAEAAYRRAIELNPSYVDAYQRYGEMLRAYLGRKEEALALHQKGLELDPLSTSLNMTLAEDYHELGRFEDALRQCQRVVEIDPGFPRAYTLMADLYWEAFGDVAAGARWLHKAVELDPGNPSHARWLAMIYLDLGDAETARSWLDIAVAAAPDQAYTRWTELLFAHYDGSEDDVMIAASALLALSPKSGWGLAALRDADLAAGRPERAVARYREAFPDLFEDGPPAAEELDYSLAIDVSLALIEAEEGARAELLLDASLEALRERPRLGYAGFQVSDVEVYALRGDKPAALSALREAIDTGWRSFWWMSLKRNRNLASLHNDPTYRGMVRELEAEMIDQRARL